MNEYDDIYEAARAVVKALGGAAAVGKRMWPKAPVAQAERRLLDALNRNRAQKLDPEELLLLTRWGREGGCHALNDFFNDDTGYQRTKPLVFAEQLALLQAKALRAQIEAEAAAADIRTLIDNPRLLATLKAAGVNVDALT